VTFLSVPNPVIITGNRVAGNLTSKRRAKFTVFQEHE
jgi:hypothetical protein